MIFANLASDTTYFRGQVFEVLPVFERYFVIRLPPQMFRTAWRRLVNRTLSSSLVPKYPWNTVVVRIAGKLRM